MSLTRAVEQLIEARTGRAARIASERAANGGCINDARHLICEDGRRFFLKSNSAPLPDLFEREQEGLEALRSVETIRVPRPIGHGGAAGTDVQPFLVLEHIDEGRASAETHERLGRELALLHQRSQSSRFGFEHDNWIGGTPQENAWYEDGIAFWRERRLGYQLRRARDKDLTDASFDRSGERLLARLDDLLAVPEEPACLLHGDLWSGNWLADSAGHPVLIDPATYYGHREADLAMTYLFGSFDARFYRAYEETWPLAPGHEERRDIYKLYHLLNHLNLFGSSYHGSCRAVLERWA